MILQRRVAALLLPILPRLSSSLTTLTYTRRDTFARSFGTLAATGMASTDQGTVRWGIVGLGDVTETKSGPPFWKCDRSELVAVMRRTPGKAAEWATRVPGDKCVGYDSLDAFLRHPLDAVYVATRPGNHLEICRRVAAAGIKNVYVEKPVGRCADETKMIVAAFDSIGGMVYTAYISRSYPRTQAVRKLLQERAIGESITHVNYQLVGSGGARDIDGPDLPWRFDVSQSGGGLVMDVGCHMVDRLDYLLGPLEEVSGYALRKNNSTPGKVEDFVVLNAVANGTDGLNESIKVTCTWDFSSNDTSDLLEIVGTKGSIRMAGMSPAGPIDVTTSNGAQSKMTFDLPDHNGQLMIQAVTDSILGRAREDFLSTGHNALRTSSALDKVLNSFYGERNAGYWERSTVLR